MISKIPRLAALLSVLGASPATAADKPNILWIVAENIGPDLGCYGHPLVQTPNLDRFAGEGLRYRLAFSTAPVCSASRSAFLTGMYQTTLGAHGSRSHRTPGMSWAMKETPPLRCTGTGGLKVRTDVGDCWDHFALVYEYANNVGVTFSARQFKGHGSPGGFLNRMFGTKGALSTAYGGDVMIRGGADTFSRGGNTGALYKEGAIANIKAFHAHVMAGDVTNATVAPSVTSNLIAILGRTAARNGRTTTWNEIIQSKEKIEADFSGLHS